MPDVSVVVPTRNRARLLRQALRTVRWQRGVDLEAVVVDDGSTDHTAEWVAGLGDPRVRVVRHERALGASVARNRGSAAAQGRYIAFLDDDDLWAPDKLIAQLAAMFRQRRHWSTTGAVSVDHALHVLGGELPPEEITAGYPRYNALSVGASGLLVSADLLAEVDGFDTALRHLSDWDLWLRLAAVGLPAVVPRPLVAYRLHRDAAALAAALDPARALAEVDMIADRYGITADRAAVRRRMGWTALRLGHRRMAVRCYAAAMREGDWRSATRSGGAFTAAGAGQRVSVRPFGRRRLKQSALAEASRWLWDAGQA